MPKQNPTPTQAIKNFLPHVTHSDLAALYSYEMEVQVNVAQDGGELIKGEGYKGRIWNGYTDGITTWKSFRIPWNANSSPEYTEIKDTDKKTGKNIYRCMLWDLAAHAEAIGMTGWDWEHRISKWVAFDFDAIINHETGLTIQELQEIQNAACNIPWITVRKSTSGRGIHLYVFVNDISTETHTEHAALARAILGKMSATAGFDFTSKVDACGGNMWIWHRKMKNTAGLTLIKQGEILNNIPINWRDHLTVVKGKRRKNLPQFIDEDKQNLFEELTGQRPRAKLDEQHKQLIEYLREINAQWWWDQDHWMLVCHTADLKMAHEELNLRGIFDTVAKGAQQGADHNAFAFPMEHPPGSWTIRRYTPGIQETSNWDQDSSGYTRCYFNREPTLQVAARTHDGIEGEKGDFLFNEAETAVSAAKEIGAFIDIPPWACVRTTQLKQHKDGRLVVQIKRENADRHDDMRGWREERGWWKRIFNAKLQKPTEPEINTIDPFVRHLASEDGIDRGWVLKSGNKWRVEPLHHIRIALKALHISTKEIDEALGNCVLEGWTLINQPFQEEFPGNRRWNRNATQFTYLPEEKEPFDCPTWDRVLNHAGKDLDDAITGDGWCKANGVKNGGDYLRIWVASLLQEPTKPLPYLFLYSREERTGKSSFHYALSLLMSPQGYIRGDAAFINAQAFNEELENRVLCAIEETDLRLGTQAYNRLKDWSTSPKILIHPKGKTPYLVTNTLHFIHCSNKHEECPIRLEDTRITMIHIPTLDPTEMLPPRTLENLLKKEAPAFMATILNLEIPPSNDRLNVPVINTQEKIQSGKLNRNDLEIFLDEAVHYAPGEVIKYNDFWNLFMEWLDPNDLHKWTKVKMGRQLPPEFPKGRLMAKGAHYYVGNVSLIKPETNDKQKYVLRNDALVLET